MNNESAGLAPVSTFAFLCCHVSFLLEKGSACQEPGAKLDEKQQRLRRRMHKFPR
ncbi:hypothetical protein ACP2W0_11960 [Pseudobacillus badius]|uniref:hypothetical protein n=1 Tax=Bacillus badius TaxID=1455 RepID=UPI002E1D5CC7|nr:hypothetical protein [Bacillus badius]